MEKTLVIIFKPDLDSKELSMQSAAIANCSESECKLVSGYYKGFSTSDFNSIIFLDKDNPLDDKDTIKRAQFINHFDDNSEIVYVFSHKYIDNYQKLVNVSFEEACFDIAKDFLQRKLVFERKYSELNKNSINYYEVKPKKSDIYEYKLMGMLDYMPVDDEVEKEKSKPSMNEQAMNVINEIKEKIVGQDEAIITLVTNILYNQTLINELCSEYYYDPLELDSRKVGILIDGTTGTGKTAILKMISNKFDLPIVISNANSFSETGYVGPTITDLLRKLYLISGKKIEKAQRGIIVLDEIDKLASSSSIDGLDMKKGVQEELLGFIGGGEYDFPLEENKFSSETIHFDTSKLTFILSGAFTHLRERKIEEQEKKKNQIGFSLNKNDLEEENKTYIISAQDYVDEGIHREFFGRIKVLTCTKSYTFDDLKNIILNSTISPLKNVERTVKMYGYSGIVYDEDFIDEVCSQALEMQTGARALQTIMSGIQNRLLLGLFNQSYDLDKPIELTIDLLHEYNKSLVRKY